MSNTRGTPKHATRRSRTVLGLTYTPFTRCNRFDNWFDNRLYRVDGALRLNMPLATGKSFRLPATGHETTRPSVRWGHTTTWSNKVMHIGPVDNRHKIACWTRQSYIELSCDWPLPPTCEIHLPLSGNGAFYHTVAPDNSICWMSIVICFTSLDENVHQVWRWFDHPLPSYSVLTAHT